MKDHEFGEGRFSTLIPEGETKYSGPCLRNALFQAGIFTDIPPWVDKKHVPEICAELGLKLHALDGGGEVRVPREGKYIVLEVVDASRKPPIAHYSLTENIGEAITRIGQEGHEIIQIIELPQDTKK